MRRYKKRADAIEVKSNESVSNPDREKFKLAQLI
jgi:hypothetical protein